MVFIECMPAERPANEMLAVSEPGYSLAVLGLRGLFSTHLAYWQRNRNRIAGEAADMILGYLGTDFDELSADIEQQLAAGRPLMELDMQGAHQSAARILGVLSLSVLLRTRELNLRTFQAKPPHEDEARLVDVYPDLYAPEIACVHVAPQVIQQFPAPSNPADTWYRHSTGMLYVHLEQPPSPSSEALERHPGIFRNPDFYATFTTITPFLARPQA